MCMSPHFLSGGCVCVCVCVCVKCVLGWGEKQGSSPSQNLTRSWCAVSCRGPHCAPFGRLPWQRGPAAGLGLVKHCTEGEEGVGAVFSLNTFCICMLTTMKCLNQRRLCSGFESRVMTATPPYSWREGSTQTGSDLFSSCVSRKNSMKHLNLLRSLQTTEAPDLQKNLQPVTDFKFSEWTLTRSAKLAHGPVSVRMSC